MRRPHPENKCCTRVAPGLETVEISNVLRFFFRSSTIPVPGIFPKGFLQSEMDDHLDGERGLLYILMIFSNLFSIFNSVDNSKTGLNIYISTNSHFTLTRANFSYFNTQTLCDQCDLVDISPRNSHIRPCQKETLIELFVDEESFRLLERVCNAIGSIGYQQPA